MSWLLIGPPDSIVLTAKISLRRIPFLWPGLSLTLPSPFWNLQSLVQYTLLGHTHVHVHVCILLINNMCVSVCHMKVYTVYSWLKLLNYNKQNILTFLSVVKILYIMNSWFINVFWGVGGGFFLLYMMHKINCIYMYMYCLGGFQNLYPHYPVHVHCIWIV